MKKRIEKIYFATFISNFGKVVFYYTKLPPTDEHYPGYLYHVDINKVPVYAGLYYSIARSHFIGLTLDRL